jgi:hypothetical protein
MGEWRTSSYSSGSGGQCLELASDSGVMVRDTKDRDGATLSFSAGAWQEFTLRLRSM